MERNQKCVECGQNFDLDSLDSDSLCYFCANADCSVPVDFQAVMKELGESISLGALNINEKVDFNVDPSNPKNSN
jgi:hypothetical protein